MRKCFLCGSLIRRRAEFCRYCTVRQRGSRVGQPNGAPRSAAPSAAEPLIWPDPPERRATPAPIAGLEWSPEPGPVPLRPAPKPVEQPKALEAPLPELPELVASRPAPPPAEEPKAEEPKAEEPKAEEPGEDAESERVVVVTAPVASHGRANGKRGSNGDGDTEGDGGVNGKTKANGSKLASEPCPREHLGGFAHFPDAGAKPKVRWR